MYNCSISNMYNRSSLLHLRRLRESRVDRPNLDIRIRDRSTGRFALNISRNSRSNSTCSTRSPWTSFRSWIRRVQPKHIGVVVVPNRHHQSHAAFQSRTHRCHSAVSLECIVVAESRFLGVAKISGDGVSGNVCNSGLRVGDNPRRARSQPRVSRTSSREEWRLPVIVKSQGE
jgi:hypothetical protein